MAPLKAGSVSDFSDSLAQAIEAAMQEEWQAVHGAPLTSEGEAERRLLFVAVARGVLGYLKAHQNEILTSITLDNLTGTSNVTGLELNA